MVIDFPVKEKDEAYFSENTEGTLEHYFCLAPQKMMELRKLIVAAAIISLVTR